MKRALPSFVVVLAALIVGAFLWSALRSTVPPHIQPRERPRELRNFPVEEPLDRPSSDVEAAMIYLKRRDDDIRAIVEFAAYRAALEDASRRAAELATAQPSRVSGDCSGFPLPAYIIQRESGGDPNAVNPSSGTFGCAQLQPFHFSPGGACEGLSTDTPGQIACTERLQAAAGLQPWAL